MRPFRIALAVSLLLPTLLLPSSKDRIVNNHLYYQQDVRVPMSSISLVYHGGGSQQEPDSLAGLADITAQMLFRGTPSMTREEIAKKFELLGADVNASASETDFSISISGFSRSISETIGLVSTIMSEASFSADELALVKKQKLNNLDAALENADGVLAQASDYAAYGGKTLGKFGSKNAIQKVKQEDVRRFYNNVRKTKVLYFTAITNLPTDQVRKLLSVFSKNRATDGFALQPQVAFEIPKGKEAIIFDSPKATNDRLRWSHKSIEATDDRRFDLDLVLDALGSSQGLLFEVLRGKNGWCYGAYAWNQRGAHHPGRIVYYADPTAETSEQLIPELMRLIGEFPKEGDFQAGLARRNAAFKNRYAYQLDLRFKLNSEINRDRFGIPIFSKDEYYKRVEGVTLESATSMIRSVFDKMNMHMVFYGDADRIKGILQKTDPSIKITVLEKEVLIE